MRFMVIVKATKDSEAPELKRGAYPLSGTDRIVTDGPFTETKALIAGYWIIQVKSKAEAIEWMKRCPNPYNEGGEIEMRQVFELEDFGESAAVEHHRALGETLAKKK